mgnify:CR=1 FL=1
MDWMQIVSALALGLFVVFLFPTAINMMKNSPKGSAADWQSVIVPIKLSRNIRQQKVC